MRCLILSCLHLHGLHTQQSAVEEGLGPTAKYWPCWEKAKDKKVNSSGWSRLANEENMAIQGETGKRRLSSSPHGSFAPFSPAGPRPDWLKRDWRQSALELTAGHTIPFNTHRDLVKTNTPVQMLKWHLSSVNQGGSFGGGCEDGKNYVISWSLLRHKLNKNKIRSQLNTERNVCWFFFSRLFICFIFLFLAPIKIREIKHHVYSKLAGCCPYHRVFAHIKPKWTGAMLSSESQHLSSK